MPARAGHHGLAKTSDPLPAQESLAALVYKSRARADIEEQGWRIGFAIGDQISDMAGGRPVELQPFIARH